MEKKHLIYKITNKLNRRFYIGMHTGFPDDDYFGSGKRIKAEIRKYGRENFTKEILETVSSRQLLEYREAEIVNEKLLKNPLCLNLKSGGSGGGKFHSKEHQRKCASAGGKIGGKIAGLINGPATFAKLRANGIRIGCNRTGRLHTEIGKKRISETKKLRQCGVGEKNSQFGTCWVTDGVKPIKIKKEMLGEYLENGYSLGRKA